jgi:hypothetical protein
MVDEDCTRCGKRKNSLWVDPVGDMLIYLCDERPWYKQIFAIAHNAKAFDVYFILNRAAFLKLGPELIMNGPTIMCMTIEHLKFIDSISFLPFPLRKLSGAFGALPRNHGIRIISTRLETWIMSGRFQTSYITGKKRWA